MKASKKPEVAAVLALVLGGPGCFYVGLRRGAKATLAWLVALFFILAGPPFPESLVLSTLLLHAVLAWKAYRSCKRLGAEATDTAVPAAASVPGVTCNAGNKPLTGWKLLGRGISKTAHAIASGFGLLLVLFFAQFFFASGHYLKMEKSIRSGMTIAELLHTVQDSGVVSGRPQMPEGEEKPGSGIALSGPHDGHYEVLRGPVREASQADAARLLQQNIVSGQDYKIAFTFTPIYGPHWTMTVVLNPDGRVKEVQPVRTWD